MPALPVRPRWLAAALVLVPLALAAQTARGQEKEHPILADVRASVKDPDRPFTLVVSLKLKEGARERFEAAIAKAIPPTRKEKGCLAYEFNRDAKGPHLYLVYERWRSVADLEAHLSSPHIRTLLGEIGELVAGPPQGRILVPVGE